MTPRSDFAPLRPHLAPGEVVTSPQPLPPYVVGGEVGEDEAAEVRKHDFAQRGGLLAPAQTLVVDLANSEVEGQRVGLLRVVRPNADVEHVEDSVCTFASELNWFGTRADEDALDLIGDIACPFDAFVSELSGRLPAQILAGQRRRPLVERVELARDVEDDVHATKASGKRRLGLAHARASEGRS